ncbi:Unknown protein sequence [Pseudomonas amygdali pv. sesami]|nr:Unknown protein sequence [Pseudomonas amygdali pv. sesami]
MLYRQCLPSPRGEELPPAQGPEPTSKQDLDLEAVCHLEG